MDGSVTALSLLVLLSLISTVFSADDTFRMIEKDPVWYEIGSDATVTCQWEHSTPNASTQIIKWKANGNGIRKLTRYGELVVYETSPVPEDRQYEVTDWGEPASEDDPLVVQTSRLTIFTFGVDDPEVYSCSVEIGLSEKSEEYTIKAYRIPSLSMKDVNIEVDTRDKPEEPTTAAPPMDATEQPVAEETGGDYDDYGDNNGTLTRRKRQDGEDGEVEMISVECVIEGAYPKPSRVEFTIGETYIMNATDVKWTQDESTKLWNGDATLNLTPDKMYDGMSVTCKSWLPTEPEQEYQSTNESSPIQILHDTSYVTTILNPNTVNDGESAQIQCESDGNPRPTFSVKFETIGGSGTVPSEDGRRFNIASVTTSDAGSYWCVATLQGLKDSSGILESTNRPELVVNYLTDPNLSQNGVVTKMKGEKLTVDCSSESKPKASAVWKKDGVATSDSERLSLSDLQYSDAGVYVCETSNVAGTKFTSFELKVEGECEASMKEPSISSSSGNPGKLRLKLECEVTGKPDCQVDIQAQSDFKMVGEKRDNGRVIVYDGLSKFHAPVSFYCIARNDRTTPYTNVSKTIDTTYEDICCDKPKKGGLSTGAIIGIILLVLVILVGIPLACYFVKKRQSQPTKKAPADAEAAEPEKEGLREKEASSERNEEP